MKLITRQTLANEAYQKWRAQYGDRHRSTSKQLKSLPTPPNPDDVDRIIGNSSWTTPVPCTECGKPGPVVQLGEEPSCDSCTTWLCRSCLEKALLLFPKD